MATTSRTVSPDRWARAAERAATEGIRVMQLPTSGVWVASSGTDATTAYIVTETDCECPAGTHGDRVCKHRAALRVHLGHMAPPIGTAPVPAPTGTAQAECRDCLGTGSERISTGGRLSDWIAVPCGCQRSRAA